MTRPARPLALRGALSEACGAWIPPRRRKWFGAWRKPCDVAALSELGWRRGPCPFCGVWGDNARS